MPSTVRSSAAPAVEPSAPLRALERRFLGKPDVDWGSAAKLNCSISFHHTASDNPHRRRWQTRTCDPISKQDQPGGTKDGPHPIPLLALLLPQPKIPLLVHVAARPISGGSTGLNRSGHGGKSTGDLIRAWAHDPHVTTSTDLPPVIMTKDCTRRMPIGLKF